MRRRILLLVGRRRIVLQLVALAAHHLASWLGCHHWLGLESSSVVLLGLSHGVGLNLWLNLHSVTSVVIVEQASCLGSRDDPVACSTHGPLIAAAHVLSGS